MKLQTEARSSQLQRIEERLLGIHVQVQKGRTSRLSRTAGLESTRRL